MLLPSPTRPRAQGGWGCFKGHLHPLHPPDPHSLCMLDGPVQGAEKCTTLLHHAVEMGLVEEVTLGITEVLGTKPSQLEGLCQRRGPGHQGGREQDLPPPTPSHTLWRALTCGDTPSRAPPASPELAPSQPCPGKVRAPQRGSPPLLS